MKLFVFLMATLASLNSFASRTEFDGSVPLEEARKIASAFASVNYFLLTQNSVVQASLEKEDANRFSFKVIGITHPIKCEVFIDVSKELGMAYSDNPNFSCE